MYKRQVFGESAKFNIKIEVGNLTNPSANAGVILDSTTFYRIINNQPNLIFLNLTLRIDPNYLASATKLSLARTIIHELIHAYFHYRMHDAVGNPTKQALCNEQLGFLKVFNPATPYADYGSQHEQMAHNYITEIKQALKEYCLIDPSDLTDFNSYFPPGVTLDQYYTAMAWGGLYPDTKAWHEFELDNPSLASMYRNIINFENNGGDLAPSKLRCN